MNWRNLVFRSAIAGISALIGLVSHAQCPEVFDFYGNPSSNPYWYSCNGNNYSFNLQSPDNWGPYTIDWGDGSPATTGASWTSPAFINHVYAATVDTFVVTITETSSGCVIQGVVVMEEATSASIQIPVGGLTQACAPQVMEFINSSTNVSETTTFTWDFGDGSPQLTFDYTNWNQMISHLYEQGTVDCETQVTLWAENYCNVVQGGASQATFNPIRIWDIDDAAITASATLLCYPDTVVTFLNTTERNCLFQGNIYQRYEYWNFGDYWGAGQDSIIDWTPWPPTFPHTLAYPGIGTYTVQLLDSNYCGIDTANITIQIVPPPYAGIAVSTDTVCVGSPITFYQQATGNANSYSWNFGNGMGWLPTGSGNITFVYNTPGTYTVQNAVAITGASSSCSDTASVQVVVLPNPTVQIIPDNTSACDTLTVTYSQNSVNAVQWNWTFDVAPFTFSGPNPPPITYTTSGSHNVGLTVIASNGCPGSDSETVQVYASPEASFAVNNLCEDEAAQFFNQSTSSFTDPIMSNNWDLGDGTLSTEEDPVHTYINSGAYTITLEVATAHCNDDTTAVLQVEPAPVAAITQDAFEGCSPLTVHFTNNTANAVSYFWNFGDGATTTEPSPTHTFVNYTLQDTTYTVVMTAENAFGCSVSDTLFVTVLASAQAAFTDDNAAPGCSPLSVQFTNLSQGATTYVWDFDDGTTSTVVHPSHVFVNNSGFVNTYTITLYAYALNGCHDTIAQNLLAFPLMDLQLDLSDQDGCSPLMVNMPFVSGILQYQWNFGDGTTSTMPAPSHQFTNDTPDPVTYDVTLIGVSPFGCTDTVTSPVTVEPSPLAQFVPDIANGCSPLTVTFQNLSISSDSFVWDYGDGSIATTPDEFHMHTFINLSSIPQVFTVELTALSDDGCSDVYTLDITVYPQIIPQIQLPPSSCTPAEITLANSTLNGLYYDWDLGNGLQSQDISPTTTYLNSTGSPETFYIQLNVLSAFGCTAYFNDSIVIYPSPEALFTSNQNSACEPAPLLLINQSTGASSYEWNYGDGTMSTMADSAHIHIFQAPGNDQEGFVITLTAISEYGCTDIATTNFTLFPEVVADFTVNAAGCSPLNATFVNQSVGASSFTWDFGNGQYSSVTNPSITYTAGNTEDATFNVQLISSNAFGCTDTVTAPIQVFHTPLAVALFDEITGCYPVTVILQNASIGADSYQWVYGTGQTSTTSEEFHEFTYFNPGTETVTYNLTLNAYTIHGCTSSDQLSLNVSPVIEADFSSVQSGCTPLTIQFDNNSTPGVQSYLWDFGDGDISNQAEPAHTFYNTGTSDTTFTVTLTIQNGQGCTDTEDALITVYAQPQASFTATPVSQYWPSATLTLDNTTTGGSLSYEWDMDDGNELYVEEPGDYTYATWGEYTIRLIAGNGACGDTAFKTIEILPPAPVADFLGPAQGCAPLTVNFTNLSQYANSSYWQFGDGGEANATNPVYTYWQPGTYTVTLTVSGYDGTTDVMVQEFIIEVYPAAIAAFTVTPNEVNVPGQPVYCLNLSQNATEYEWIFNDGTTSEETHPIHYFQEPGVYSITLIANNAYNCPDTATYVNAVYATAVGMIDFPNAFTPNTTSPGNGTYDPNGYNNDVFFPLHKGVTEYKLQIFNKWGELLFESNDVNIGWNGYYRDELCRQDVYAWKARARFIDGQEIVQSGDVTLLTR